jgi:uncharacterized protein (TIGR00369 family)
VTLAATRDELERVLASAAFNAHYRFRRGDVGGGECRVEVPFRDEFERPGGVVSGPVFMAAADAAIWLAVLSVRGAAEQWVTVDLTTAFLRAARREPFSCTARLLRTGRQVIYAVAECVRPDGVVLTHHMGTYARVLDAPLM